MIRHTPGGTGLLNNTVVYILQGILSQSQKDIVGKAAGEYSTVGIEAPSDLTTFTILSIELHSKIWEHAPQGRRVVEICSVWTRLVINFKSANKFPSLNSDGN